MSRSTYHPFSILLHWIMAIAFGLMFASGLSMGFLTLSPAFKFNLYQWHKSLGVILLGAFFVRLVIRLWAGGPLMPESFAKWEKFAAKAGHLGLYVLMVAMPISGWIMVSSSIYGLPTIVFGLVEFPHFPGIAADQEIEELAKAIHGWLGLFFGLLIIIHIAAVIKHTVIDRHNLLHRMGFAPKMIKNEKGKK